MYEYFHLDNDADVDGFALDRNMDGNYDAWAVDHSGNGIVDAYYYDTDYNGTIDNVVYDANENGNPDVLEQPIVMESPTGGGALTFIPAPGGGYSVRIEPDPTGGVYYPGQPQAGTGGWESAGGNGYNYDSYNIDSEGDGVVDARDNHPANPYAA